MSHPLVIALHPQADPRSVQRLLTGMGVWTRPMTGGAEGPPMLRSELHSRPVPLAAVSALEGVAAVYSQAAAHPLVDAQAGQVIAMGPVRLGAGTPILFAGPCGAESREQVLAAAAIASKAGATVLRGGAFKPRTSPYSFQGHGSPALSWLSEAASAHSMALCTEVLSGETVAEVAEHADILQIGSRNMQNYALLGAVGQAGKPVLLKRAMSATIETWLLAGEHLLNAGASAVIFCERGIVGFDGHTRNLIDLGAVAVMKHQYGQPVVVDPSHALGRTDLLAPMALAALAAGADGIMVETHPHPCDARSDGPQALNAEAMTAFGHAILGTPIALPAASKHPNKSQTEEIAATIAFA